MMLDTDTIIEEIISKRLEVQFKEYFIKKGAVANLVNIRSLKSIQFFSMLFLSQSIDEVERWYYSYGDNTVIRYSLLKNKKCHGRYSNISYYLSEDYDYDCDYVSPEIINFDSVVIKFYNEFMLDREVSTL